MQQRGLVVEARAEALQRGEVVGDAGFLAHRCVQCPIAVALRDAESALEMRTEVGAEAVVVEQRVVHVEQPYGRCVVQHGGLFSLTGSRQPSSPANKFPASAGPQVPGS